MMRSMFSGVAGLRNHQIEMDAIGNNIANVNTVGYKGSRVSFEDTLNQMLRGASAPNGNRGGINALQIGLGMNIACVDILESQGNLQTTGRLTDVAIQGDGFFVMGDGNKQYYTRAGNFDVERDGKLVSASNGMVVQGWMADNLGKINTSFPVTGVQLPLGQTIAPIATTKIQLGGNLAANTNAQLKYPTMTVTDTSVPPLSCTVEIKLTPKGFNTWDYQAVVSNGAITSPVGTDTGTITLNENGVITSVTNSAGSTNFQVTPSGGKKINIQIPVGSRIGGGDFVSYATGTPQTNVLNTFNGNPGNFNLTVTDAANNVSHIQYQITSLGNNHYSYTIAPTGPPPATLPDCSVTGGTGTFDWTLADGLTNVSGTDAKVTNNATTIWTNTISPPVMMGGVPTFPVTEMAPENVTLTPSVPGFVSVPSGSSQDYNIDVTNANGEVLTTLNYTFTNLGTGAFPFENYSWTLNSATGANITGAASGTCTLDTTLPGGTITAWANAAGNDSIVHTTTGVDVVINPLTPPVAGAAFGLPAHISGGTPFNAEFTAPDPVVTTTKVYDSIGNAHSLTTTAIKVGNNSWDWSTVDENNKPLGHGTLTFGSNGQFISSTGGPLVFTPPGAQALSIMPDFSKVSQYAGSLDENNMAVSGLESPFQDGYPMGELQSFNIDTLGRIIGIFSNGKNQQLAQIALANFTNPGGLTRAGDTLFEESANSGTPQIGEAGQNGRGDFTPGAIEMSNVDLSQEFTTMITTERGFQANSRIITTSDEMLQDLVNLKR